MIQPVEIRTRIRLDRFDPAYTGVMDREETREATRNIRRRIGELQKLLYANQRHSIILVLQGMDTSGKEGAGRNVLEYVSATGVETTNFKVPSAEELAHDFLWRVHKAVPRFGNIGIFNRSHYEDVLVTRVLNLRPKSVWSRRYNQINQFEKILTENNVILLKFFLHISKEEQALRLEERLRNPAKNWKFESGDLLMRKHWDGFQKAYEDVINKCNIPDARWHVVPSDHKWYRDYLISTVLLKTLKSLRMKWPEPPGDFSKIRIDQ